MQNKRKKILWQATGPGLLMLMSCTAAQATSTVDSFTGGNAADPLNFQSANNWTLTKVPTTGNNATFVTAGLTTGVTVDVKGSSTIDGLTFGSTSPASAPAFTLGNSVTSGVLTLDANGGNIITTPNAQANLITISTNLQLAPVTPVANLQLTTAISAPTGTSPVPTVVNITGNIGDSNASTGFVVGLLKTGNGGEQLSGTNTFGGNITVQAGFLYTGSNAPAGSPGALGNSTAAILLGSSATAANGNPGLLTNGNFTIGRDITVAAGSANSYNNLIGGNSNTASSTFTGTITLNHTTSTTFFQSNSTGTNAVDFQGVITGTGALTKSAYGTAEFDNANNNYTGTTTIRNGVLIAAGNAPAGANGVLGNATTPVQIGDTAVTAVTGATISLFTNGNYTVGRDITVFADTSGESSQLGGFLNQSVGSMFTGNITLSKNLQLQSYTTAGSAVQFSGPISSAVSATGIQTIGSGTVLLSGTDSYSGATTVGGDGLNGTLTLADTGSLATPGITVSPGATANINGLLSANPNLSVGGTTAFGPSDANNNPSAAFLIRNVSSLSITTSNSSSGTVILTEAGTIAGRSLLKVGTLTLSGSTDTWVGKLDLTNNDLVVTGGGSLAQITNQVKQAFNNGAWNGSGGITSSSAASDTTHLKAIGVIANSDGIYGASGVNLGTFDGYAPAPTDILVKYTYYGDANLDGKVDGSDYSRIDSAYSSGATGWYNGDFNYDGTINGSDYTLIDNAFNTQGAALSASIADTLIATSTAEIASSSAVPEPNTLGILAVSVTGLIGRRRRR